MGRLFAAARRIHRDRLGYHSYVPLSIYIVLGSSNSIRRCFIPSDSDTVDPIACFRQPFFASSSFLSVCYLKFGRYLSTPHLCPMP